MLNLAGANDYAIGLTQQSPNLLDYIHGGSGAVGDARQGGVAVCVKGQLTSLGTTPTQDEILDLVKWLDSHVTQTPGIYSTDRLQEAWPPAAAFTEVAAGLLVISVSPEPSNFIMWFRPELVGTVNWAGEPKKHGAVNGDQLNPRKSFEVWKETIRGRSLPWTPGDLDAAFDLRVSLLHVVLRRINEAGSPRQKHDREYSGARVANQPQRGVSDGIRGGAGWAYQVNGEVAQSSIAESLGGRVDRSAAARGARCLQSRADES
jgi:light-regulated signal transduction histidine kinase (bacteriophytochrome)